MYRVTKVISAALLAFIIVTAVTVGLGSMADDGVILDAWYAMIGYIPFGNVLAPLCMDFFQDVVILLLTAVCFEAVNNFVQVLMGVKEKGGIYNVLLQMISGMVAALLSTFAASIILNVLCRQLVSLPKAVQGIISVLVTLITVSGAVGVLYFVLGIGLAGAIGFVFLKIVLTNTLKVAATYTGTLLVLLFLSEKAYLKMVSAIGAWAVVIILLIGVDMMLSSVYDH